MASGQWGPQSLDCGELGADDLLGAPRALSCGWSCRAEGLPCPTRRHEHVTEASPLGCGRRVHTASPGPEARISLMCNYNALF